MQRASPRQGRYGGVFYPETCPSLCSQQHGHRTTPSHVEGAQSTRTLQPTAQRGISSLRAGAGTALQVYFSSTHGVPLGCCTRIQRGIGFPIQRAAVFYITPHIAYSGGVLREMCPVRRHPVSATPGRHPRRPRGALVNVRPSIIPQTTRTRLTNYPAPGA